MSTYSSVPILLDSLTSKQEETIVQNDQKKILYDLMDMND